MSQTFFCDCLNVTIRGDLAGQQVNSIPDELRSEHFKTATILAVSGNGVKINHECLILKRTISNWQIIFCAVCEKETHAVLLRGDDSSGLVLVSSNCSNNIQKMNMIMADPDFLTIFGIRFNRDITFEPNKIFLNDGPSMSQVATEASMKVEQLLWKEKVKMDERIKEYVRKEHEKFEKLCESAQKEKEQFLEIVETIYDQDHGLIDYSDKENNLGPSVKLENLSYSQEKKEEFFLGEEASMFEISSDSFSKQTGASKQVLPSGVFDDLFQMDDIEGDANGKRSHLKKEDFFDDNEETAQEAEDAFPAKDYEVVDLVSERRYEASGIPLSNQSRVVNSNYFPNSLPITIPRHMSPLAEHEDNITNPNDSIADRMKKIARSVRNNVPEFLDERPRRRLNTVDLVKSRNYSQNL